MIHRILLPHTRNDQYLTPQPMRPVANNYNNAAGIFRTKSPELEPRHSAMGASFTTAVKWLLPAPKAPFME